MRVLYLRYSKTIQLFCLVFSLSFSFFYHISFCLTSATAVVISFYYFLFVRQVLLLLLQLLLLLLFCQAPDTTKCKTQKNAKRDLPTHYTLHTHAQLFHCFLEFVKSRFTCAIVSVSVSIAAYLQSHLPCRSSAVDISPWKSLRCAVNSY